MNKKRCITRKFFFGCFLIGLMIFKAPNGPATAKAGPLDDLKKLGDDLNNTKHQVDEYVDPAHQLMEASKPWTLAEELSVGRIEAAKLAHDSGGLYNDPQWEKYLNLVGRGLAPCSMRTDIKYRFAVLNSDEISTYSAPGGYVFITKGMLKQLASEDELAGVLANEIAHVALRHVEQEVRIKLALDALLRSGLTYANNSGQITHEQKEMSERAHNKTYELMKSKCLISSSEYEADQLGTDNITALGYHPAGLLNALTRLQTLPGKAPELEDVNSKCPRLSLRVKKLKKYIDKQGYDQGRRTVVKRFQEFRTRHPLP